MTEVLSILLLPIAYLLIMALIVTTVVYVFVETFTIFRAGIAWFKALMP